MVFTLSIFIQLCSLSHNFLMIFLVMILDPMFHCQKAARSLKFKTSESQEQYEILTLFSQSLWTSPFCWLPEQRLPTVWGQMGPDASHRTEAAAAGVCHQTTVVRLVLVSLSLRFKQTGTCRFVQKDKSFSMFSSFCPPPEMFMLSACGMTKVQPRSTRPSKRTY